MQVGIAEIAMLIQYLAPSEKNEELPFCPPPKKKRIVTSLSFSALKREECLHCLTVRTTMHYTATVAVCLSF